MEAFLRFAQGGLFETLALQKTPRDEDGTRRGLGANQRLRRAIMDEMASARVSEVCAPCIRPLVAAAGG
jgi:hypothetical protein